MATKLIIRNPKLASNQDSPFGNAINKVLGYEDTQLSIACPYLSTDYLKTMVTGRKNWRLLTDINEWLGILRSEEKRSEAIEFIREHRERIRSYNRLHAKVVIGNDLAMLGSANFTKMGLREREEVAVLIDDSPIIQELQDWFDGIWNRAYLPTNEQIEQHLVRLSKVERVSVPRLPSKEKTYTTRSPQLNSLGYAGRWKHLAETMAKAPNRKWINDYLDLVEEVITLTGLESDDPRLVTSCTQSGRINVNLRNRLVLGAFETIAHQIRMIAPFDYPEKTPELECTRYKDEGFDKSSREEMAPRLIGFKLDDLTKIPLKLKQEWRKLLPEQPDLDDQPKHKKRDHEPLVWQAAMDLPEGEDFRKKLLDEADELRGH